MAITKAVIPVAGRGTRLLPATKSQPKEMLPIGRKPIVQYVVEELVDAGLDNILFVTGRKKRSIEDHFDYNPELGMSVRNRKYSITCLFFTFARETRTVWGMQYPMPKNLQAATVSQWRSEIRSYVVEATRAFSGA